MATCPGYPALPGVAQARRYVAGSSQLRIPYLLMVDDAEGIYALTLGDLDDPLIIPNWQIFLTIFTLPELVDENASSACLSNRDPDSACA
jgi:hypothetical protein